MLLKYNLENLIHFKTKIMKNNAMFIMLFVVTINAIAIFSCQKEKILNSNNQTDFLKAEPDTNWAEIAYIDANDIPVLSVTYLDLVEEITSDRAKWYDDSTESPNLYVEVDTIYFEKYFKQYSDTVNNNFSLYLVVEGFIQDDEDEQYEEFNRLAYTGVKIYDGNVYLGDGEVPHGGVTIHSCEGDPCTMCEFTYAWTTWFGNGPINGCNCATPNCPTCTCNHQVIHVSNSNWSLF